MGVSAEIDLAATDRAEADHERFLATRTFGSLDGLRALSILAVLWHHTHPGVDGVPLSHRGFLGVDLFFAISGYLIITLLLRERRRTGTTSLRNFYIRRFLRIFPPYYGMLLAVGALAFLRTGAEALALRRELPYALLYLSNFVPMTSMLAITWSLSVEEQFYLVVPALQKATGRWFALAIGAALALSVLPPFGLFPGLALPAFFRETTFAPILLGVLLALALDEARLFRAAAPVLSHPVAAPLAAALVLAACSHPAEDISGGPRLAMQLALTLLVATCVVREDHPLAGALRLWPMQRVGVVSYGIYLFHLPVRHGVEALLRAGGLASSLALFAATTVATWLVAELSYRVYESRWLELKARWI